MDDIDGLLIVKILVLYLAHNAVEIFELTNEINWKCQNKVSGHKKTWVDILKLRLPFFRAPVRQGDSCPLGSQSGEKRFPQNISCYISLERKFDADHFLRKDLIWYEN